MFNQYWWDQDEKTLYKDLFALYKSIEQNQTPGIQNSLDNYRLYGNLDSVGLDYYNYNRTANTSNSLKLNVIQSCVDTVTNKISKNNPRIKFLTTDGDESQQSTAKKLNKFIDGQFYKTKIYEKGQMSFRDAAINGDGIIKTYRVKNEIRAERIIPLEILVDDNESLYGTPANLYQKKWISREQLLADYPDFATEISMAKTQADADYSSFRPTNGTKTPDMILTIEAWHLPTNEKKDNGRHVICIDSATLYDDPAGWCYDYFPFSFIKWNKRPVGFYGKGLGDDLRGIQIEINKTVRTISLSNQLVGVPRLFVNSATKIVDAHINDNVGNIIRHDGPIPQFVNAQPIHPDVVSWLRELYQKAYELSGVSQLSAQSKKPSGLDSGVAIREFNDIESERFILIGQAYERFYMDIADKMLDLAQEIEQDETLTKEERNQEVEVIEKKFVGKITWKEINLKNCSYVMRMHPVSSLTGTISDKLQQVNEYINLGVIQREDAAELLNFPDVEAFMTLETAAVEDIKKTIELILTKGEYSAPEPFQNLTYGLKAFQQAYLRVRTVASEDKLQMMRDWMATAQNLLKQAQAEASAMQAQAQGVDKTIQSTNGSVRSFV